MNCFAGMLLHLAKSFLLLLVFVSPFGLSAQVPDSIAPTTHIGGVITVTQNGISLIPSFSLGKPAVMFDMNLGGKKLTFEPFFRFGLDGRPWSFIFWGRYKAIHKEHFRMSIGAHPSYVFRTTTDVINGIAIKNTRVSRYVAMDLTPTFRITKRFSTGLYYLYSHGLDASSIRHTHFITLNAGFSDIRMGNHWYANFNPQVYYLNQTGREGYYYTHSLTLSRRHFPISAQTIINKAIRTTIAGKNVLWNFSLLYRFSKEYVRQGTTN